MQLPLAQLIRPKKGSARELPVLKRPKLSDYFNPQSADTIIEEVTKLQTKMIGGQAPT